MKPVKVFIGHGGSYRQETADGYYIGHNFRIENGFIMEDGSFRRIENMENDEILDALRLASAVGKELEKKGFRVAY